jgi:hypothetical protein
MMASKPEKTQELATLELSKDLGEIDPVSCSELLRDMAALGLDLPQGKASISSQTQQNFHQGKSTVTKS